MSSGNTTETLIGLLRSRDELGQSKYGATLDRTDLTPEDWLQHGLEEALDLAGYLQSAKREIGLIRGENIRLAMENLRLRSVLLPFVELAKAISLESPEAPAELVNTPPSYSVATPSTPLPSISEPIPEIQSSIQVTPTEVLEVLIHEDDSLCARCGTSRVWCPTDWENGRVTNPGYYYDCENPTCGLGGDGIGGIAVQEDPPVLNILSSVKMLSTPPTTLSKPAKTTYTAKELAEALGCHKDSIINYRRAGLIGEPIPGTGTSMTNLQRFEVPSFPALRKSIAERQEAAKKAMGRPQTKAMPPEVKATFTPAPTPTFDIDDQGREAAIETGKAIYGKVKIFYLSRLPMDTRYSWDTQPSTMCDPGWEVVEEWRCNGLGRWESTPNIPGAVGVGTGIHRGAVQGVICG